MTASTATPSGGLAAGWRTLIASPDRILVPTIALSVPAIAVHVLLQHLDSVWVAGNQHCLRTYLGSPLAAQCGPSNGHAQLALLIGLFAFIVVGHLVVAGIYRAILDTLDGAPVRSPLQGWNLRSVLPTSLVLGALLTIGTLVLLIPGLILGFFTRYALLHALDGLGPLAAITASFEQVGTRFGSELWFTVRAFGLLLLGTLVLGIGLYVAIPVVLIAQALRYRAATSARAVGVQPEHRTV